MRLCPLCLSRSAELEQLFPSLTLDFANLDASKLSASLRVATPFAEGSYEFFRPPRAWIDFDNGTTYHHTIGKTPQGWLAMGGDPYLLPTMQIWLTNALLRAGLGDPSASIRVGIKDFPSYITAPPGFFPLPASVLAPLYGLFVPLGTSLVMPLIASVLVAEKAGKQRSLMVMMSLRMRYYWLAEWLWNTLLVSTINLVFFSGGVIGNVQFMLRSPVICIIVLLLWGQCTIGLALLSSCFFRRVTAASIGNYMLIFLLCFIATTLLNTEFRAVGDFPPALALVAPFGYARIVQLLVLSTYTIDTMSAELATLIGMLVLDAILYTLLAFYLDAVLPREFGVRSHPLFFLRPLRALLSRRGRRGKTMAIGPPAKHCTRIDVDHEEDSDVRTEREYVERAELRRDEGSGTEESAESTGKDPGPPLIVSRSLRKVFSGGKVAVRNLSMSVRVDECFGFLGPNGAGKTTAISVWTGLYEATSGSATVCGFDIRTEMHRIYGRCGVCPQFDILWPLLTVRETLRFYSQLKGLPKSEWDAEVHRAVSSVELSHASRRQVFRLSGGMKRRVSFAVSLIGNPRVVFLDEPTTGLDPETKRSMWALVDAAKPGRSIVLTTHSMEEADALSDRIGIMAYGSLRCIGTSLHLKDKFGAGHKIDLVVREGWMSAAMAFVSRLLTSHGAPPPPPPSTQAMGGSITIPVSHGSLPLSELFEEMNARPDDVGIEQWALRQTSMEEVFLHIARQSEVENAKLDDASKTVRPYSSTKAVV